MNIAEIIMLALGTILFFFAIVIIAISLKRRQKLTKYPIWLILIAFIFTGFSAIIEAEILGFIKFKRNETVQDIATFTEYLNECPENEKIITQLNKKIEEYEANIKTDDVDEPLEAIALSKAYLAIGDNNKALQTSEIALKQDTSNNEAIAIKQFVDTKKAIEQYPSISLDSTKEIKIGKMVNSVMKNPAISNAQKEQLVNDYTNKIKLLRDN